MSRGLILRKLLSFGPMQQSEIVACTGWPLLDVVRELHREARQGRIKRSPSGAPVVVWRIADEHCPWRRPIPAPRPSQPVSVFSLAST